MSLTHVLAILAMSLGSLLMLIAAIGVLRLPDVLLRMQAATKASSLGAGLALAGVALYFAEVATTTRALAAIAFILLTTPVAAHVIGRAAYAVGVELAEETWLDELAEARAAGEAPEEPPGDPTEGA